MSVPVPVAKNMAETRNTKVVEIMRVAEYTRLRMVDPSRRQMISTAAMTPKIAPGLLQQNG